VKRVMTGRENITGVVLAGGQSRRMGQHKALLPWKSTSLLQHLLSSLEPAVAKVMVAGCPETALYAGVGAVVLDDRVPDFAGPLAGIYSAMLAVDTDYILTLPCDCARVPEQFVERLSAVASESDADAVVAFDGERQQPLYALWHCRLAPALARFLIDEGERRVMGFLDRCNLASVAFSEQQHCFFNINTPEDYRQLLSGG